MKVKAEEQVYFLALSFSNVSDSESHYDHPIHFKNVTGETLSKQVYICYSNQLILYQNAEFNLHY